MTGNYHPPAVLSRTKTPDPFMHRRSLAAGRRSGYPAICVRHIRSSGGPHDARRHHRARNKPEVLGRGYGFTEGPTADRDGNVFFSDGQNNSIYRWRPGDCPNFRRDPGKGDSPIFAETKIGTVPENGTVPLGPRPAITLFTDDSTDAIGMMFNAAGELYVCEGAAHRIVAFDLKTGPLSPWERARVRAGSVEDARMLPSLPAPLPKGEGSCPGDGPNFSPLSSWERARVRAGSAENAGIRPSPPAPLPEGEGSCPGVPL